jgi:hypothetical protein
MQDGIKRQMEHKPSQRQDYCFHSEAPVPSMEVFPAHHLR